MDQERRYFEGVTGERAQGCPWRSFWEPVVSDVMELHRAALDGPLASVLPLSPPAHLWEALLLYRRVRDATQAQCDEEERVRRG